MDVAMPDGDDGAMDDIDVMDPCDCSLWTSATSNRLLTSIPEDAFVLPLAMMMQMGSQ